MIPMAFLIVFTGCLSLLSGFMIGVWGEVFNHANQVFISMLIKWIEMISEIPGGHSFVQSPS